MHLAEMRASSSNDRERRRQWRVCRRKLGLRMCGAAARCLLSTAVIAVDRNCDRTWTAIVPRSLSDLFCRRRLQTVASRRSRPFGEVRRAIADAERRAKLSLHVVAIAYRGAIDRFSPTRVVVARARRLSALLRAAADSTRAARRAATRRSPAVLSARLLATLARAR